MEGSEARCYAAVRLVAVAQLVEPSVVVRVVAGSSPVSHPSMRRTRAARPAIPAAALRRRLTVGSDQHVRHWSGTRRDNRLEELEVLDRASRRGSVGSVPGIL